MDFRYSLDLKDDTLEDHQRGWAHDFCEVFCWIFFLCPSTSAPLPSLLCFVPQETYWYGSYQWDPLLCCSQMDLATPNQEIGERDCGKVGVFISQEVASSWLHPFTQDPRFSGTFFVKLLFLGYRNYSLSVPLQI